MEKWIVTHKIKALYDEGNGMSQRDIARKLGKSCNTVAKYLSMSEEEIAKKINNPTRARELDDYWEFLTHLIRRYPRMSSVKARRKLEAAGFKVEVKPRTFQEYVKQAKVGVAAKQSRYYEPVLDMVPGEQAQVDAGEQRGVLINGEPKTIYFVTFVLSYSRYSYTGISLRPINTEIFIRLHDEAFRFFGGVPGECVYDQTKLVAVCEEFREVWFNEAFYQYATTVGIEIRVCEGYDPESKGKVEAGVKYVKGDFFYGEEFKDAPDLRDKLKTWLDEVANPRIHGSTRRIPAEVFEMEEASKLKPYLTPDPLIDRPLGETRKVDKTSLISFKSSKYSVPMKYQSGEVLVRLEDDILLVLDIHSGEELARHRQSQIKGEVVKNPKHYRDREQEIIDRETKLAELLGDEIGAAICALLKATNPKIYKDQLCGLLKVIRPYSEEELEAPFIELSKRSQLKVSFIKTYLSNFFSSKDRRRSEPPSGKGLEQYAVLTEDKEVAHAVA